MDKRRRLATHWARRPLACALSVALALAATPTTALAHAATSTTALADSEVEILVKPGTEYDVEHNGKAIDSVEATDQGCALEVRVDQSEYDNVGVSVTGDVSLSSTPTTGWSNARALWVNNQDGKSANVTVGGDVTAEAPAEAYGLYQEHDGATTVSVKGDVVATSKRDSDAAAIGINQVAADSGPHFAEVGGNIVATGDSGKVGIAEGMCLRGSGDGGNTVLVLGDVTATGSTLGTGLMVNGDAPATVLVAGTLSGSHVGIGVEGRDGVSGIDVTVWKIAVGEGGTLFSTGMQGEAANEKGSFAQTLAKNINYILKVNQSAGGKILAVGANGKTRTYDAATLEGLKGEVFQVAVEGEEMRLRVTPDAGYRLARVFDAAGNEIPLKLAADGSYILGKVVVDENGQVAGGYLFSAEFEKDDGPKPEPKPDPKPQPAPDPDQDKAASEDAIFSTGGEPLPATGDATSFSTIAMLALSGAGLALAGRRRRR